MQPACGQKTADRREQDAAAAATTTTTALTVTVAVLASRLKVHGFPE